MQNENHIQETQPLLSSEINKSSECSDVQSLDKEPLIVFKDFIYQMDPSNGIYEKISKEDKWNGSAFCLLYNGLFYVISIYSGKIYAWNPKDKSITTISEEKWINCRGMIVYNDYLYLICDYIYKMDPNSGKYSKVSKEGGWLSIYPGSPFLYRNKIYMNSVLSEKLYVWNIDDCTFEEKVGKWKSLYCFCEFKGKLYSFMTDSINEIDIDTKEITKISDLSCLGFKKVVVRGDNLFALVHRGFDDDAKGEIWKFSLDGSYEILGKSEWISSNTIL